MQEQERQEKFELEKQLEAKERQEKMEKEKKKH